MSSIFVWFVLRNNGWGFGTKFICFVEHDSHLFCNNISAFFIFGLNLFSIIGFEISLIKFDDLSKQIYIEHT